MKFKINPLTGEFNIVPDSGTYVQKYNWMTGVFNLTTEASAYKQKFNSLEGEFNLRPAITTIIIERQTAPIVIDNGSEDGLVKLIAYGGTEVQNVPVGYTQLDYITLNRAYFDTGILPTTDTDWEIKFKTSSSGNTTQGIFGALNNSTPSNNFYFMISSGNKFLSGLGTAAITLNDVPGAATDTEYLAKVSGDTLTINGETATNFNRGTLEATDTIYFGVRKNSTNNGFLGSIYYLKLWQGGTLVAHYVPCIRNSDEALGYYNLVTNQFYTFTDTTYGTPVAGQVAYPTPNMPMDIICNNGVLKVRHQSGLPIGYKKLLSIYNSTSAVLDTGIKLADTDRVETRVFNSAATQYGAWYGIYATGESSAFYANGTYYGYDAANNKVNTGISVDTNGHDIVHDFVNGKLTVDGEDTLFTPFEFTNTVNNKLFCRYYNNSYGYNVKGWMVYYKVYRNDILILDLIPCTRESDSVVGMYDLVSGTFIGPDEGYTFEEGTAANDPIVVYADGTVETINAHTRNMFNKNGTLTNGYYKSTNGEWVSNAAFRTQDYIKATQNTDYVLSVGNLQSGGNSLIIAAWDSEYNWLGTVASTTSGGDEGTSVTITGTTPADTAYLSVSFAIEYRDINTLQIEEGSIATEYVPYFDGGTATCEMLLSIGDTADEQEILSGEITRKVGIKVLTGDNYKDGQWGTSAGASNLYSLTIVDSSKDNTFYPISTHFTGVLGSVGYASIQNGQFKHGSNANTYFFKDTSSENVTAFKDWLAQQYTAGTPVIVLYPLVTTTTEQVEGQDIGMADGNNIYDITQASLDNLELSMEYQPN